MRIFVDKKKLADATKNVIKARAGRTTIEAMKCFKIDANTEHQEIKITASNNELSVSERIDAKVEDNGSCLVQASFFTEAVAKCEELIEITEKDNVMKINSGKMKLNAVTMNVGEFPNPRKISDGVELTLNKDVFQKLIDKTMFAASQNELGGIICGVLFEINQGNITAAGVDGFRMSVFNTQADVEANKKIVIKGKILNEITKILNKAKAEEIKITIDDQLVRFDFDKVRITASLLEGDYVEYNKLFPTDHHTTVIINKNELYDAIDRSTIVAFGDDANKHNLVKIQVKKEGIVISSSSQMGNISEEITAHVTGNDLLIGFNARYILDALKKIEEDEVRLEFQTNVKPLVIKIPDNERFRQLILPVRITS